MPARSHRIAGPEPISAGSFGDVVTVPDGETWIVKSVRVVNPTSGAHAFDVTVNGDTWAEAFFWDAVCPAKSVVSDATWWVLEAGDVLSARVADAGDLTLWMSGSKFVT